MKNTTHASKFAPGKFGSVSQQERDTAGHNPERFARQQAKKEQQLADRLEWLADIKTKAEQGDLDMNKLPDVVNALREVIHETGAEGKATAALGAPVLKMLEYVSATHVREKDNKRDGFSRHNDEQPEYSSRAGASLIEVLVVISVISVLLALLLPAVQQARTAANRMQADNQLRQTGLAAQSFESTHGHLPNVVVYSNLTPSGSNIQSYPKSPLTQLGDYMEAPATGYNNYAFGVDPSNQGIPVSPSFKSPLHAKGTPEEINIALIGGNGDEPIIHSVQYPNADWNDVTGDTSYNRNFTGGVDKREGFLGSNNGATRSFSRQITKTGIEEERGVRTGDITDGATQTAYATHVGRRFGQDMQGADSYTSTLTRNKFATGTHRVTTNEISDYSGERGMDFSESGALGLEADVSGTVPVLFADGHVQRLSKETDSKVLKAIGSVAGGEVESGGISR